MADPTTQQLQQAAAQAAQANNIPVPVFMSLIQNESSWRPHVVSSQGAIGPGQLLPGTARDLAVNPNDPIANINGTARYFRQKLDKWGNLDDAVRAFHGGDDTSGWGPLGEQEVARVTATAPHYANFGSQPAQQQPTAPADPYETALIHASNGRNAPSASPTQAPPQSSDPFEAALINASNGHHGSVAPIGVGGSAGVAGLPGHAGDRLGNQTGPGGAGIPVDLAGNQGAGLQAGAGGNFGGAAGGTGAGLPQDNGFQQDSSLSRASGLVDSALSGFSAHLIHPLTAGINTILPLDRLSGEDVNSLWDGSSLSDAFKHDMGIETGHYNQFQQAHPLASGLATVRNICAHHSRLWNRRFTVTFPIAQSPPALAATIEPSADRRLYNTLSMLLHSMVLIAPNSDWAARLAVLVAENPISDLGAMGFPDDWRSRPLWTLLAGNGASTPNDP